MKIRMMVLQFSPAHRGGAEMQCLKQATALAARGHLVTILTEWLVGRSARREIQDGVVMRRLGFFLPVTVAIRRLHRGLRLTMIPASAGRPDIFSADGVRSGADARQTKIRWMAPVEWLGHLSFMLETGLTLKLGRLKADIVHVHESRGFAGFAHWLGENMSVPVFCKEALAEVLPWPGMRYVPRLGQWRRRRTKCTFIATTPHIRAELERAYVRARDEAAAQ